MWQDKFKEDFPTIDSRYSDLLKQYTYTHTGGPADVLVFPENKYDVQNIVLWANKHQVPLHVLGNASNVIIQDGGIRGLVIMFDKMRAVTIDKTAVFVESGVKLVDLVKTVSQCALSGLEFACGIPGSVGGAVYMNAGAYGGEMKDVIVAVDVVTKTGDFKTYTSEALQFGYRHSVIQQTEDIIIGTHIQLVNGNQTLILDKIKELTALREEKQPLEYPSCGSVFKRPEGHFAGKLIQDAQLQGKRIGGVEVSKKHAGFMVNIDNGTAQDYQELIKYVQEVVLKQFGVQLETEVRFIGEQIDE